MTAGPLASARRNRFRGAGRLLSVQAGAATLEESGDSARFSRLTSRGVCRFMKRVPRFRWTGNKRVRALVPAVSPLYQSRMPGWVMRVALTRVWSDVGPRRGACQGGSWPEFPWEFAVSLQGTQRPLPHTARPLHQPPGVGYQTPGAR